MFLLEQSLFYYKDGGILPTMVVQDASVSSTGGRADLLAMVKVGCILLWREGVSGYHSDGKMHLFTMQLLGKCINLPQW